MKKIIWITWEHQIRNVSITNTLDVQLFVINHPPPRLQRYYHCIKETIQVIRKETPDVIVSQNPSIMLTIILSLLKIVFKYKHVIDAHFGGIKAFNGNKLFQLALNICNKNANLVIVTNDGHKRLIEDLGGAAFIYEDPLPKINSSGENKIIMPDKKTVFFICSYDIDEPFEEVFKAAEKLANEDYLIIVSGNYHKANIHPNDYPYIMFTGFISYDDFACYLTKSDVIIDLTSWENCLVCGAYEAMSAGKPLVTSDTNALRNYFYAGTLYTSHEAGNIANAIRSAYNNRSNLKEDIQKWKKSTIKNHQQKTTLLLKTISSL